MFIGIFLKLTPILTSLPEFLQSNSRRALIAVSIFVRDFHASAVLNVERVADMDRPHCQRVSVDTTRLPITGAGAHRSFRSARPVLI